MRTILIAILIVLATQVGAKECPTRFLKNGAVVFDAILICVTEEVPDSKLRHAANVAAQWLDNDQNGTVDEPILLSALQENEPILLAWAIELAKIWLPKKLHLYKDETLLKKKYII